MQALWLEAQKLSIREVPIPKPRQGEALVKVRLAGICSTDLELVKGYYPYRGVLGHEFVGEVVEAKENPDWIGERVVGEINITCGSCKHCLNGRSSHCINRKTLGIHDWDGAFAEYLVLPINNLHRVPKQIDDEEAVFTEPLAAALEIQQQIHLRPTSRLLIVGAGRLGLLIAQSLALTGCELQVVARRERTEKLLKLWCIPSVRENDVQDGVMDVVVEATGSPDGFEIARKALRPRGLLVLKSTYQGAIRLNLSSVVVDEITIVGSRCGPFKPALFHLASGRVDPKPLIDDRYPLHDASEAFQHAAKAGVLKILFDIND
jgi:threonine dehydrogenase-like Zn-dependent dehydrogenase